MSAREMRPARAKVFTETVGMFGKFGVDTVALDEDDFAGFVQRTLASGACEREAAKYFLEVGRVRLGGLGTVVRFEWQL